MFVDLGRHDKMRGDIHVKSEDPELNFLGFIPLSETTGGFMTETLVHKLKEMSLSIKKMRVPRL